MQPADPVTVVAVQARDVPRGLARELAPARERTTFHEAGHALVPLLWGIPVEHAAVGYGREELPGNRYKWTVTGVVRTDPEYDKQLGHEGLAIFTAAGSAAEAAWAQRRHGGRLENLYRAAIVDNSDDNKYLMEHVADGRLTTWAVLDRAMELVQRDWWRIKRIARELDRQGHLVDHELRRVAQL